MLARTVSAWVIAWCVAGCAVAVAPGTGGQPSCTLPSGGVCAAGATCPAGDGCNECACAADGSLRCTQRACPTGCRSDADCPSGACILQPGCATPGQCGHLLCARGESTWCDCAGSTFTSPDSCPHRMVAHEGPCASGVVDAGVADVTHPHTTPCHPDGQECGSDLWCCGGYCDRSDGGPGACRPVPPGTFACGTTYCRRGEYCELIYSDVTSPDSSRCRAIPGACNGSPTCACVPQGCARTCSQRNAETIVLQCLGG